MWSRMICWVTAGYLSVALYLSSLRRRSSRSWILFSSWETPAEERDWPSMSDTRLRSSFSCRDSHRETAGQHYPQYPQVKGQCGYVKKICILSFNKVQREKMVFWQIEFQIITPVIDDHKCQQTKIRCVYARVCVYMSLHGILVQLQVLFRGSLLHELRAQLINLVSAPGHSVCHHLRTAFFLLQLQFRTL